MTKTEQIAVQTINIGGSEIPVEQKSAIVQFEVFCCLVILRALFILLVKNTMDLILLMLQSSISQHLRCSLMETKVCRFENCVLAAFLQVVFVLRL